MDCKKEEESRIQNEESRIQNQESRTENQESRIENQESRTENHESRFEEEYTMAIKSFTEMNVWKKAHQVTLGIYRATKKFPDDERFGLVSQMRRAAVSIPANIAEGFGRRKKADKARFYNVSEGSVEELKYFLILARDLGYVREVDSPSLPLEEVSRMLRRLVQTTLDS